MDALTAILFELSQPEVGATPSRWMGLAAAHYCLGFFLATWAREYLTPERALYAVWIVLVLYSIKEVGDVLLRGGSRGDSFVDTAFVAIGLATPFHTVPATILAAIAIIVGTIYRALRGQ